MIFLKGCRLQETHLSQSTNVFPGWHDTGWVGGKEGKSRARTVNSTKQTAIVNHLLLNDQETLPTPIYSRNHWPVFITPYVVFSGKKVKRNKIITNIQMSMMGGKEAFCHASTNTTIVFVQAHIVKNGDINCTLVRWTILKHKGHFLLHQVPEKVISGNWRTNRDR